MNGIGCDNAPKLPHEYPHANSKLGKSGSPPISWRFHVFCYSSIIFRLYFLPQDVQITSTFHTYLKLCIPPSVRFSNKTKLQDIVLHVNP